MTTLAGLLPELILSISDFLPLVDLICLSLCNHRFFHLLRRTTDRLPLTQEDKFLVFTRLENDHPEYFACDVCILLHRYDGTESFGLSGIHDERTSQLPCVQIHEWEKRRGYRWNTWFWDYWTLRTRCSSSYLASRLSFVQLKLAMRRFCYGPRSGISTESLAYTQVRQHLIQSDHPDRISLFSMEAQICPEHLGLYIRMKGIILVRTWDESIFEWGSPFEIYAHFGPPSIMESAEFIYDKGHDSFAYHCSVCNTET